MSKRFTKCAITLTAISAIALHVKYPQLLINDSTTLILVIAAFLPWLSSLIEEAAFPGGWSVKFRELEKETDTLRQRLDRLVLMSLSDRLRSELRDFRAEKMPGEVEMIPAYRSELEHLHHKGFLRFKSGVEGFDSIPQKCQDIYDFLEITDLGREYLELSDATKDN